MPLILSGAPGSGKSCIALLILSQYIESSIDREFPILYVRESKNLASNIQRAWQALPVAQKLDVNAVQFKSYKQLIKSLTDVSDKTFVNKSHCINWLKETHIKHYKRLNASPLFWLSSCPDEIDILKLLFNNNTILTQSITVKGLCLSPSTDLKRNTSPLALLSDSSNGREILTILGKNNPKLGVLIKWHYQNNSFAYKSGLFAIQAESTTVTKEVTVSSEQSLQQSWRSESSRQRPRGFEDSGN